MNDADIVVSCFGSVSLTEVLNTPNCIHKECIVLEVSHITKVLNNPKTGIL